MSNQRRWFQNFKHYQEPKFVRIGNGKLIPAIGSGNIDILAYNGKNWIPKFLSDVLYVPNLMIAHAGYLKEEMSLQREREEINCLR
jgi:hypothetical protein